jgi:hypothetical protein
MRSARIVRSICLAVCASGALTVLGCGPGVPVGAEPTAPRSPAAPASSEPLAPLTATATAAAEPGPSSAEGDLDRALRLAKGKRDQCLRLGSAIEVVLPEADAMVVEGNSPELTRMAQSIERAASEIDQVPLEADGLAALRKELTSTWRGMAEALGEAARARGSSDGKQALTRFRDRESRVPKLFGELSELCNRPGSS